MKIIFFGLGGAGQRHIKLLQEFYPDCELFALRTRAGYNKNPCPSSVCPLVDWDAVEFQKPDIAFICNPTHLHIPTAIKCAELGMHLFIEKPIGHNTSTLALLVDLVAEKHLTVYMGYPLHFHDSVKAMQEAVAGERVLHAEMVCTSNLATWRPGKSSDYYSAHEHMGGGALLDLSHELYLAQYLFGAVHWLWGTRGRISGITIDTDDYANIIIQHQSGVVCNIHLNLFTDNPSERWVKLHLESGRTVKIETNPWPEEMDRAFVRQIFHFINNLDNPMLDGNLLSCVPLFRQIVDLRERTKI